MESWSRSALYEVARANREGSGESAGAFFLTLCSVPAPIALPETKSPTLQRFRFFFSRQTENGTERCWLHFGYFRTVEEARKWREVLCRVYPAAAIRTIAQNNPASKLQHRHTTLEDTLNELRDSTWEGLATDTDEVSSTGVRHLRVEVQTKARAAGAKSRNTQRKS